MENYTLLDVAKTYFDGAYPPRVVLGADAAFRLGDERFGPLTGEGPADVAFYAPDHHRQVVAHYEQLLERRGVLISVQRAIQAACRPH